MLRIAISELGMVSPELCELCGGQEPRPSPSLPGTDRHRRDEEEQRWSSRADKSLDRPLGEEVSRTTAMAVAWRASGVRVIFLESPSSALRRSPIIF